MICSREDNQQSKPSDSHRQQAHHEQSPPPINLCMVLHRHDHIPPRTQRMVTANLRYGRLGTFGSVHITNQTTIEE